MRMQANSCRMSYTSLAVQPPSDSLSEDCNNNNHNNNSNNNSNNSGHIHSTISEKGEHTTFKINKNECIKT